MAFAFVYYINVSCGGFDYLAHKCREVFIPVFLSLFFSVSFLVSNEEGRIRGMTSETDKCVCSGLHPSRRRPLTERWEISLRAKSIKFTGF